MSGSLFVAIPDYGDMIRFLFSVRHALRLLADISCPECCKEVCE